MDSTSNIVPQSSFHTAIGISLLAAAVWMQGAADSTEGQASEHFREGALMARNAGDRLLCWARGLDEFTRLRPGQGWLQ
jgi:hypothetical protein